MFSGFGFRVSGFGFRVSGFGCLVSGFGFRVSGFGFRVPGFGVRHSGFGIRVSGVGFQDSDSGFQVFGFWSSREDGGVDIKDKLADLGFVAAQRVDVEHLERVSHFGVRVQGLKFRVWGFGSGVWGLGFRVSSFGIQVSGVGFRISGAGSWVSGFKHRVSGIGCQVSGVISGSNTHPVRRQECGKEEEMEECKELQCYSAMELPQCYIAMPHEVSEGAVKEGFPRSERSEILVD